MATTPADIEQLALIAERGGWRAAVHDYLRPRHPVAYRYATDAQTATWRMLVSVPPSAQVTFLFPDVSVAPFLFAREGATVTCACASGVLEYAQARASQEDLSGLSTFAWDGSSPADLPEASQDLVVAVGAWDAPLLAAREPASPATVLYEATRLLRPGGQLFVSARNRGEGGLRACRRALAEPGFTGMQSFGILPSPWQPFFLTPLDAKGALRHCLLRIARGYDFSQALSPAAWALWRTAAGPGAQVATTLGLSRALGAMWPAYGLLAERGGA